jgi:hypothetical protein
MVYIHRLTGRLVFLLLPLLLIESWESRRGNRGRRMDSPVPRRERGLLDPANRKNGLFGRIYCLNGLKIKDDSAKYTHL